MTETTALQALAEYVQVLWEGGHLDRLGKPQQIKLEDLLDAAGYGWGAEHDEAGSRRSDSSTAQKHQVLGNGERFLEQGDIDTDMGLLATLTGVGCSYHISYTAGDFTGEVVVWKRPEGPAGLRPVYMKMFTSANRSPFVAALQWLSGIVTAEVEAELNS